MLTGGHHYTNNIKLIKNKPLSTREFFKKKSNKLYLKNINRESISKILKKSLFCT